VDESINKTVYFLGAGASCNSDFHLPTMKEFFHEGDFVSGEYNNLKRFINEAFSGIPFEQLNLEDVITALELSPDNFGSFGKHPEVYIYEARREIDRYIKLRLTTPDNHVCQQHKKFIDADLAGKDSKDSIISLNYDLIVDRTLYELSPKENVNQLEHECLLDRMYSLLGETQLIHGKRASLYHKHKRLGFYLKLHGSIDWIYCPNVNCTNHQLFFPNWLGSNQVHNEPGDLCSLCGSPLLNVIVPPTMHKTFDKFPKLGFLWSLAYRELNQADIIVIFGVSFTPSDYYLQWLLKKAVIEREAKPTIFDIDISESASTEIEKITGVQPIHKQSLDGFLEDRE
jgi:hypothetical protein